MTEDVTKTSDAKTLTPSTKAEQMTEDVTKTSDGIGITEGKSYFLDSWTLQEIFDRKKSYALDYAEQLVELIPDIKLDEWFEEYRATDDNRPMRECELAQELRDNLQIVEYVKLIIALEV